MNRFLYPIRREFWEYRGTFIALPLISALLIALLMIGGLVVYSTDLVKLVIDSDNNIHLGQRDDDRGEHRLRIRADVEFDRLGATEQREILQHMRDGQREILLHMRDGLREARAELGRTRVELDREEIAREIANARRDIAEAQREMADAGIHLDLSQLLADLDQQAIEATAERSLAQSLAQIERELTRVERQLADIPPTPPTPPTQPAPEGEWREFPSQVIVIDSAEEAHFGRDKIAHVDQSIKVFYVIFSAMMVLVSFFYLLACLYTDRRDNSILFWKSLPVSEAQNVLTKLFVALVLLPSIAVLAALATSLVYVVLAMIFVSTSPVAVSAGELWSGLHLFSFAVQHWGAALATSLWCLPFFAWLLFASAAARKSPFLMAVLPPVLVIALEELVLDRNSHWFVTVLSDRLPGLQITDHGAGFLRLEELGINHLGSLLASSGLWLGLLVAAALVYAAIWLRDHRYEI